ncbi:MAG: hypothetical protein KAT62_02560 [Desulfuromonadales bacterium]|nr:hypothetical protein [Desulfuromonadales bacterium]
MSKCSISTAMWRIKDATEESQIAVFAVSRGVVDAMFADSVVTRARIKAGDKNFIGCFDGMMKKEDVLRKLNGLGPKFTGIMPGASVERPKINLDPMTE